MPELKECLDPLEATEAVSLPLLPVSTPLSELAFFGVELVEDDMSCNVSFFTEVSLSCRDRRSASSLGPTKCKQIADLVTIKDGCNYQKCYIPRLRTRSNFSLRMAMKCFISGKYSVILPWPLLIDSDKGLRWYWIHLGFLLQLAAE